MRHLATAPWVFSAGVGFAGVTGFSRRQSAHRDRLMASGELIVLIVRNDALRSALIARLSLQGESLVTLDVGPQDPVLDRIARAPKILVVDSESLGDQLSSLVDGGGWKRIIILADHARHNS